MTTTTPSRTTPSTNGPTGNLRVKPRKRRRNVPLIALGALLAVVGALISLSLVLGAGDRHPVLVVTRAVPAGQAIRDGDLAEALVAVDGSVRTIPANQRGSVVGRVAAMPLLAGSLLAPPHLSSGPPVDPGFVVAPMAMKPGQFPPSLRSGDTVVLIATPTPASTSQPPEQKGTVLVDGARVFGVDAGRSDQLTVVSLVVPESAAPAVASASSAGQVVLVLKPGQ